MALSSTKIEYTLPNGQQDFRYINGSDNVAEFKNMITQNEYNAALAQMQNNWNIEQWNRENEYNTPSAQIERLLQAGVNPLLMDISGNLSASSPSAVGYQSADVKHHENDTLTQLQRTLDALGTASDTTLGALRYRNEVSKLQLDTEKNQAEINKLRADTVGSKQDSYIRGDIHAKTWENNDWYNDYLASQHYQAVSHRNVSKHQDLENEILEDTKKQLKALPRWQLRRLMEDVKSAKLTNDMLGLDKKMRVDYGLDTKSPFWTNFLMMGLRNPDSYNNVIDGILQIGESMLNKVKPHWNLFGQ